MSLSRLLQEIASGLVKAKSENFTGHHIANLIRKELVTAIREIVANPSRYIIKSSPGAGNWADVPWLSILNPDITKSTQSGVYPVYLFSSDGKGIYLSLGFGTTELKKQYGSSLAVQKATELRNKLRNSDIRLNNWDQEIDLKSNTELGKSYEWATAGAKYYPTNAMPDDSVLSLDLAELLQIYDEIDTNIISNDKNNNVIKPKMLSKSFLLLAGISGTGKTRFVREQAKASKQFNETYCLTSVRPDWQEPGDLLGYITRLSGTAEYVTTDVLQFIAKAWRGIVNNGLTVKVQNVSDLGERLVVTGNRDDLERVLPYWLCLDEMNLAPVEQYFADYLSVLETQEWLWDGDDFIYSCDALLKSATINEVAGSGNLRQELGFGDAKYDGLWQLIGEYGLGIPFNLIVAGTVNMDETTHGFSRKVIDRALSFDFGVFFPNDFDEFFEPKTVNKTLSYPILSHAKQDDISNSCDPNGDKTKGFLKAINAILKNTPFELAFRAMNELLISVACTNPEDESTLMAVWDDFMMCKVLPRIEGDVDKLTTVDGKNLLDELSNVLASELSSIWGDDENDKPSQRPDLYREYIVAENSETGDKTIMVACRSKEKLAWMQKRLDTATFTSFWP